MEPGILADFSEEFEGQVRDVIPDFDVPTVEDLREPIVDCRGPEMFDSCWCRPLSPMNYRLKYVEIKIK